MSIPRLRGVVLLAAFLLALAGCATTPRSSSNPNVRFVGAGGHLPERVSIGDNVQMGASGLAPGRSYEFDLLLDNRRVGFARATADGQGTIRPLILLYQSGVIGCSGDWAVESRRRPLAFRDFDEAERALNGRSFRVELREADVEARERRAAFLPSRSRALASIALPTVRSAEPTVFPSTRAGCLLNSAEAGGEDMFVSGRGFRPGETIELAVALNQIEWHVGDPIENRAAGREPVRVRAGADGRFTVQAWDRSRQQRGAYDIIARRLDLAGPLMPGGRIDARDVISFNLDTAYILFLYYPPGGTQMDIAGRHIDGHPWFEFADSFATTGDEVWGGVDPTYVMAGHPGGTFAAYTVVAHRPATGTGSWANTTGLLDVSGAIEVGPVKAGCINGTYLPIWQGTLPIGDYDVVVNFGSVPATSLGAFVNDNTYSAAIDYLDGGVQIGFVVAEDPYVPATPATGFAVGQTSYGLDDALLIAAVSADQGASLTTPRVDLRAVVRYPATMAGVDTPVAAGPHPILIMQHGNHYACNAVLGAGQDEHADCPLLFRERNHEGYMHLLDTLASRGIIAVSIDAFDLTGGVPFWIAERADLNLMHLEFWSHLNNPSTYTSYASAATQTNMALRFNNRVDLTKVSVSGHSRGGEASVATYLRNLLRPVAQRFGIVSVSSIAPTDFNNYVLGNVPYFVILPAADGDVQSLAGAQIYDRAGTATNLTVKSGIDVYGANHNYFNTVWAADGEDWAADYPRPHYLLPPEQQEIGESYIAAFTLSTLRGMTVYEDMLRGRLRFPTLAGNLIYHFRHETPFLALDNGNSGSPVASGFTAATATNPSVHETIARQLGWSAGQQTFTYTLSSPADVSGFEVLSFRAAQTNATTNTLGANIEFIMMLGSGSQLQYVITSQFAPIPPPYDRPSYPLGTDQNVMTTVRIPLHSYIMNNSNVNLTAIDRVQLIFYTHQGEIYVDDVEFSR